MNVEQLLPAFQARLRAFAFGPELDHAATELAKRLATYRRRRADIDDRATLKALALLAEYWDAMGRAQEAAQLLRLTVEELIDDAPTWPAALAASADPDATRRLLRQRVWCAMAYAQTQLRAHQPAEAGRVIERMCDFVDHHLATPNFPCHGTLALTRYYRGLWRRNRGLLNEAAWDFDAALDHLQRRLQDKQSKYQTTDPDRLRRETIYHRVGTARVLGFGHGGIALSRGRYLEARGWLLGAQQILAQLGQEMWRLGLEVYSRSATVLVQELAPASRPALTENADRLQELAQWFADRNPRQAFVAEAFSLLATIRLRQIDSPNGPLNLEGLRRRLDNCLRNVHVDGGPLSATAALHAIECLLRAGDTARCEAALDRFQRAFGDSEEAGAEFAVLRAELWMATNRLPAARAALTQLVEQRPANRAHRARAWALLSLCEQHAGQSLWADRAMTAARESLEHVQDGSVRAWIDGLQTAAPPSAAMPFQHPDDDDRWCDLDHNLEMARLHVVETVYRRYPGYTVERLATVMGRGHSWLYAFLGRHREMPWVKELLSR
jgi:tetratricopeptide (TPR) repeat protein